MFNKEVNISFVVLYIIASVYKVDDKPEKCGEVSLILIIYLGMPH